MKNFCYCIGGTGTRVAEAAAHLCAANLAGKEDITFIIVDKDATCGGTKQALNVIQSVASLAAVDQNGAGALQRSAVFKGEGKSFCMSNLTEDTWDFSTALDNICKAGSKASLKKSLCSVGKTADSDAILFDAFFSKGEQEKETSRGFYGHPSIGALIFKYMIEEGGWCSGNKEDDIAAPIKDYLAVAGHDEARVFIIGSIFGGTGASVFSNLASHIRNSVGADNVDKVKISGVLLLPYFAFPQADGTGSDIGNIDSNDFNVKSKVALSQYGADPNLMKTSANPKGVFDSLYVCGQSPAHITGEINVNGGEEQKNHLDFVDLAAAKAMAEFFAKGVDADTQGNVYEYRFDPNGNSIPRVELSQIPSMANQLKALLLFSGMVICRMYGQYKIYENDPWDNFMLEHLYGKKLAKGFMGGVSKETRALWSAIRPEVELVVTSLYGYCQSYIRFLYDIAKNGHDWSGGTAGNEADYNFFNPSYIYKLKEICDLFLNKQDKQAAIAIDNLVKNTSLVPGFQSPSITQIDDDMRNIFNGKAKIYDNDNTSAKQRVADYAHEVFKYCLQVTTK